jgi:hypothetical protein
MSDITPTEMWDIFNYLKNLQLLKSKVDSLEHSDLRDQLLLEIEKHQNCFSIPEVIQILRSSQRESRGVRNESLNQTHDDSTISTRDRKFSAKDIR